MMYIRQMQILVQAQICTWLIVYTKKDLFVAQNTTNKSHYLKLCQTAIAVSMLTKLRHRANYSLIDKNYYIGQVLFCQA